MRVLCLLLTTDVLKIAENSLNKTTSFWRIYTVRNTNNVEDKLKQPQAMQVQFIPGINAFLLWMIYIWKNVVKILKKIWKNARKLHSRLMIFSDNLPNKAPDRVGIGGIINIVLLNYAWYLFLCLDVLKKLLRLLSKMIIIIIRILYRILLNVVECDFYWIFY